MSEFVDVRVAGTDCIVQRKRAHGGKGAFPANRGKNGIPDAECGFLPVIAGEQGICSGCGIATLSISYYDIGYRAGEMAYEILAEGADISTMEIETAPQVTKMYNPAICEELGITVPDDYEAIEAE